MPDSFGALEDFILDLFIYFWIGKMAACYLRVAVACYELMMPFMHFFFLAVKHLRVRSKLN